ncbi:MAG TPA: arginine--tRNA ligase, partial [Trueperaceae bacterium]|nr:arginine--tRNA ligase [Trueperaceae bacterium]
MTDVLHALNAALQAAAAKVSAELLAGSDAVAVPDQSLLPAVVQEVPAGKPGDYGSPVAFSLARLLRRPPPAIASAIVAALELPAGVAAAEAVGAYINFEVEPGAFVGSVVLEPRAPRATRRKVIVEHTSVNPNKEAHVGHLRNVVLGDSIARILTAVGHDVEVQNYIDDTGRQAAESIFAVTYFKARYEAGGSGEYQGRKYDHWLGELYVRLTAAKETDGEAIERGVNEVMHRLERGELRDEVERVLRAQLVTYNALGAEYDLLVWESDIVRGGLLDKGVAVLERSPHTQRPTEGKFAGALVLDVSEFLPGLEEPLVVILRSDGSAMYVAKDIGYQFWKAGLFEGLSYERFARQPSGKPLYTSSPEGELHPDGRTFAHAQEIVNVIDVRQSHPQTIVKTALALSGTSEGQQAYEDSHHLAYEVVTLEGQAMSGRKGVTLSIDEVMGEAVRRARAVVEEKNPDLPAIDAVAQQVGIAALRFGMVKSEAKKV